MPDDFSESHGPRRQADQSMIDQVTTLAERFGRMAERQEKISETISKHEFALFGFNGRDGGLMHEFKQLDDKVDGLHASLEEKFSKLQKAAIASVITFCVTGLPALVVALVTSH